MHNQSDFGYSTGSSHCIACGSSEPYCCDGTGTALPEAVKMLMQVKSRMMHRRRFGRDGLNEHRHVLSEIEGDVEEWLIENGFQKSEHDA